MFKNCMTSEDPRTLLQRRLDADRMRMSSDDACDCDCSTEQRIEWGCDKSGDSCDR